MAPTSTESLNLTIEGAAASWQRHLRASNKAPRTITGYLDAVTRFGAYLTEMGMPRDVTSIKREHVESWVGRDAGRGAPTGLRRQPLSLPPGVLSRGYLHHRDKLDQGELHGRLVCAIYVTSRSSSALVVLCMTRL